MENPKLPYVAPTGVTPPKRAVKATRAKATPKGFPKPTRKRRIAVKQGGASKALATDHPRMVEVVCQTKHAINGKGYGPGLVRVPEDVAAMLREGERRVVESEERFYGKRAFIVQPGRRVQPVAYETFTDSPEGKPEIGTAHGVEGGTGKWEENR